MFKPFLTAVLVLLLVVSASAQQPRTEWAGFRDDSNYTYVTPAGLHTDAAGNIYLAASGNSLLTGSIDMLFSKFSPSGQLIWTRYYDSPGSGEDRPQGLLVDAAGNFYLTGWYQLGQNTCAQIVKVNADGDTLWARQFAQTCGLGIWVHEWKCDASGNIYCGGKMYGDEGAEHWVVAKFLSDGSFGWLRTKMAAAYNLLWATALVIDADGNVAVTGLASEATTASVLTCKYSTAGDELWCRSYAALPDGAGDNGRALAVDAQNNLIVVGQTTAAGPPVDFDLLVIKFNPDGDTLWTRRFSSAAGLPDFATEVACDSEDNIIVTGYANLGEYGIGDLAVLKYTTDGQLLWSDVYDGVMHESDAPGALVVTNDGDVVVVGTIDRSDTFDTGDLLLRRYDSAGTVLWDTKYFGIGNSFELAKLLAADVNGYWIVSGWSFNGSSNHHAFLNKYSDYICGDADGSDNLSISDVVRIVNYIFSGGSIPDPTLRGDANCNGILAISDAVYLITFIFGGGPAPCAACP